jgi:hypothetical protein
LLEQLIITLSCRSTLYRTWTCTTTRRASGPSSTAHPQTSPHVGTADHNSIWSMLYRTLTCTTTRRVIGPWPIIYVAPPPTSPLVGTADHNSILQEYAVQNLDLYYDTESQWPLVYSSSSNLTSCRDKESVLQVQSIMEKEYIEGNPGTDSEAYLQHHPKCHTRTDVEGTLLIVKTPTLVLFVHPVPISDTCVETKGICR